MDIETMVATTADGREVAIWRTGERARGGPVVVLGAGFGRRMRHVGPVASYLEAAGATVYRYDNLDHLGLSDGTIRTFTMTSALESLQAAVDLASARENAEVTVVAASLAGRVAYRLIGTDPQIARLITLVGVVNLRGTLRSVIGADLSTIPVESLAPEMLVEGHLVDIRGFARDAHGRDWLSLERCASELVNAEQPVFAIISGEDTWVSREDVDLAFADARGTRVIVNLPYGEHDLSRNPAALRQVLRRLALVACSPYVIDSDAIGGDAAGPGNEPAFDDIVTRAIAERKLERSLSNATPVLTTVG